MVSLAVGFAIAAVLGGGTLVGIAHFTGGARIGGETRSLEARDTGAIETLKERYVAGDIDEIEYERRLETLYEDAFDAERSGESGQVAAGARSRESARGAGEDRADEDERAEPGGRSADGNRRERSGSGKGNRRRSRPGEKTGHRCPGSKRGRHRGRR